MRGPGIAAALCALAAAGCGGGGDGAEDEERVADVIEQTATVDDPAHCTEFMTENFLEQTESGQDALVSCQEDEAEGEDAADSVEVSNVQVDGDGATAEVAFSGGPSDGQALAVELVKDGEDWKLDRIAEFVTFDRDAYLDSFAHEFEKDGLSEELADCAVEAVDALTDEAIEELVLSGDDDAATLVVAENCPTEYREGVVDRIGENASLTPALKRCITSALSRLPDERFVELTLSSNQAELDAYLGERCAAEAAEGTAPVA